MDIKLTREYKELKKFVRNKDLPVNVGAPDGWNEEHQKAMLNHMGFKVLEKKGTFFICKFPAKWRKVILPGTKEWCYLYDDKGRKRAAILYKFVSMGDGKALDTIRNQKNIGISSHMNYMTRFRTKVDHTIPFKMHMGEFQGLEHRNSPLIGHVMDSETNWLFRTDEVEIGFDYNTQREEYLVKEKEIRDKLYNECEAWLKEHLPDYDTISAYWDDDINDLLF